LIKEDTDIDDIMNIPQGKARFTYFKKLVKNIKVCPRPTCNAIVPNLVINKAYDRLQIEVHTKSDNEEDKNKKDIYILTVDTIYSILRNISDEDCEIIGINPKKSRPEEMIIDVFPVPALQVRPSVKKDPKSTSEMDDDLIHSLAQIIKMNEKLKEKKESGIDTVSTKRDIYSFLTLHISTYIDNSDPYTSNKSHLRNNKEIKSITARLKGKEGRMRNNLMGKRVNYSARTVITSDPNISIHHVGIPLNVAMILTYSEYVSESNIEALTKLVRNGPYKYPGANYVKKNISNEYGTIDIRSCNLKVGDIRNTIQLKVGDIVDRHLINGDIVLFNRQPSLHKMSMMGHICHIIPDRNMTTFRLNVNITEPYNADFDGKVLKPAF
jgi:DNA-directed RNA polymerase II subunit RPB1